MRNEKPWYRMRRSLAIPIAPAPLPLGITLAPFDRTIAPACRELMNRAYAAGTGDVVDFDHWWPKLVADKEYDPTLCRVAMRGPDVVGFCHAWTSAFIKDLVVDARCRRIGLGAALVTLTLGDFLARGADHVDLKTDFDNLAAQALYRRLGFVIVDD
jgi:ribosomal protein S18 acetylase RimI-like enzyme